MANSILSQPSRLAPNAQVTIAQPGRPDRAEDTRQAPINSADAHASAPRTGEASAVFIPLVGKRADDGWCQISIDDLDLAVYRWQRSSAGYAIRRQLPQALLHRLVLERVLGRPLSADERADHINGDKLDCRRSNLRVATPSQNNANAPAHTANGTSQYRGVYWNSSDKVWCVEVCSGGKKVFRGRAGSEAEAARLYNEVAAAVHGQFARLNQVPDEAPAPDAASSAAPRPTAPYHCDACGSDNPYVGRKPRHRGGNACKACSAVEKAIHAAHNTAMRAVSAEAYRNNLTGEAKAAVMKLAEQAGREAWNAARASYGIGPGWGDELLGVGASATGGSPADVAAAIVAELRAMAEAGLIGPSTLTDAAHTLMDAGQDVALAADRQVA